MTSEIDALRTALRARPRRSTPAPAAARRAGVAAIMRPAGPDAEVLLIRRALRAGDPWSGHIAFPGGKAEPEDLNLRATAERETFEEVGLDLARHEYLGRLGEIAASPRGAPISMLVAPHVFALEHADAPTPNGEVAEVLWASLGAMRRGELDAEKRVDRDGERLVFPAYGVAGHLVWGLTHRMLQDLLG